MTQPDHHDNTTLVDGPHRKSTSARRRNRPSTTRRPASGDRHQHPVRDHTLLDQYYGTDSSGPTAAIRLPQRSRGTQHSNPEPKGWVRCPYRPHGLVVHRSTGVVATPQCGRLRCPSCIVPRAIQVGQAIALAQPTHWITLTQVGNKWVHVQQGMKMFKQRLRRLDVEGYFAYNVEPSDHGHDGHAHLWWRGVVVEQSALELAATAAGFGRHVRIGSAFPADRNYSRPTIDYGLKMVLRRRPSNPEHLWPAAADYLELNGGRLVHSTRGFWLDREGVACTQTEAARQARNSQPADWMFVA